MNLIQEAHEFLTGWCQIQLVLPAVLRVNVADNMMKFFQLARVAGNAGFVQGVVFGDVLTAAGYGGGYTAQSGASSQYIRKVQLQSSVPGFASGI